VGHVSILLLDESGTLVPRIARTRDGKDAPREVAPSLAQTVIEQKVAVLSDVLADATRATPSGAMAGAGMSRNAACAPLIAGAGRANLRSAGGGRSGARIGDNFERFFTPHLAARIAASPEALGLGGERRTVSVLFADIRGFTELAARMAPDETARFLTEYFTEMVECVFRHGGTLDKFIGDAVMAQWGAPIGERDDCDRAMQAALDMMEELDRLNARWRTEGRPTLEIGIGLNVGDVFAGNIGSDRRLEYTVIGDPVNVSSRLCGAAGPGEILISDPFRRELGSPPVLEPLPPMELKGKSQA